MDKSAKNSLEKVFAKASFLPIAVRDKVHDVLKEAIVRGYLPPGARLIEVEIAKLLRISRTPLREALLRLEAEGFVERVPSGGVRVKDLSEQEVRELYAVRSVLEGLAAREAARRLTKGQLDHLRTITRQIAEADGPVPDVLRIARLGEEFHQIILEASGNQKCAEILRLLRDHIDRYRYLTIAIPGRGRAAAAEHESLVEVLETGDPDEAERAMRAHVLEAGNWMLQRLRQMNLSVER